jgi:hypothetical protein
VKDRVSATCCGAFEIAIDAAHAIELFTPEGERRWVEGWEPHYPDPDRDRRAAGTAFVTRSEDGERFWLITAAAESSMAYSRFDPRGIVAAIEVVCTPVSDAVTRVDVSYTLTALNRAAEADIAEFAAGYDGYLAGWKRAIEAVL